MNLGTVCSKTEKAFYDRRKSSENCHKHYKSVLQGGKLSVYKRPLLGWKFSGLFGNTAVSYNIDTGRNKIKIYEYWFKTNKHYTVSLNGKNFPGLIDNSIITDCFVVPYMRNVDGHTLVRSTRIAVITDKGQIYHNNPDRATENAGKSLYMDAKRFEESAVWDLPGRRYPSLNADCGTTEYYFPYLPKKAYDYHPAVTDKNSPNKYGNSGFDRSFKYFQNGEEKELSRFYIPIRDKEQGNPFFHIGGIESDYKLSLIGTYRSNTTVGARTCVFATDDGGRSWFCKYEFGDSGEYEFNQSFEEAGRNFGNPIIIKSDEQYEKNSIAIAKRTLIYPSSVCKEPSEIFQWDKCINVLKTEMNDTATLTTEQPHKLKTGNIIALLKNAGNKSVYDLLCNTEVNSESAGNGILFKVYAADEYTVKIYEYTGNPFNNICCRHIHQINRVKDGWLIGTGEIYPNGWLLYFQMKESDTFTKKPAYSHFDIYRLNSTESSVQRTLGAILSDDKNQTLIYASDHDLLARENIALPEDRSIAVSRSSTGIFAGKLSDIDDMNLFEVLKETAEPAFFFKKIDGVYYWCGQRGQFMISENLRDWIETRLEKPIIKYGGTSNGVLLTDDYIIVNRR